jgi:hypothetical protein
MSTLRCTGKRYFCIFEPFGVGFALKLANNTDVKLPKSFTSLKSDPPKMRSGASFLSLISGSRAIRDRLHSRIR